MKVLLAEDSRTSQMVIKSYIEDAGHALITVDNGKEAVEAFKFEHPDLVLMDVTMPVMDGIEATQEIRKLTEKNKDWVPIIFLSGKTQADDIVRGIDAGGDDYLAKPVDATVLNAKLRAMERIAEMRQQLQQANRELQSMAVKDGLTGLANRRHFDEVMKTEFKRCFHTGSSLSLVLCDIDHFKLYNDNYGHQAGDDCLKEVAAALQQVVADRTNSLAARYGGEEFAFILPDTQIHDAAIIAESIKEAVSSLNIQHKFSSVTDHVTLSCGVTSIKPEKGQILPLLTRKLIAGADHGLYKAKDNGRNQVAIVN